MEEVKMNDLYETIQQIKEYYKEISRIIAGERGEVVPTFLETEENGRLVTREGWFAPNTVDVFVDIILNGVMDQLSTSDIGGLENLKLFNASCGDSRALAVGTLLGFDCYGLDSDDQLIEISRRASRELYVAGIIPSEFRVGVGSYLSDEAYRGLGISFSDIDYIIHSINSSTVTDLIEKFANEAKDGAQLILLGSPLVNSFGEEAREHDLLTSKLYRSQEEWDIQGHYFFSVKGVHHVKQQH